MIKRPSGLDDRGSAGDLTTRASWALADQLLRVPLQAITFIVLARAMGSEGYGAFAAALAVVAICSPFAGWGSGNVLISRVARDRTVLGVEWGNALIAILVSGTLLIATLLVVQPFLLPSLSAALFIAIGLSELVFARTVETAAQIFQAVDQLREMTILRLSMLATRLASIVVIVLIGGRTSPTLVAVAYVTAGAVAAVVAVVAVHRTGARPSPAWRALRSGLREGFYFSVGGASVTVSTDVDKPMLARLSSLESAGVYTAAYKLVAMAFLPVMSLLKMTYARFFREGAQGVRAASRLAVRLSWLAMGYSIAAALALIALAPLATAVLGDEYGEAVSAIRWLAVLPLAQSLHLMAANALTGAGFQRRRSLLETLAAAQNVVLNLWLIPLHSWRGAIVATVISEFTLAVALWIQLGILTRAEGRRPLAARPPSTVGAPA